MSKRILLIDGDLIAYRFSAIAESRTVLVKTLASGEEQEFKTRTLFKKYLVEQEIDFDESHYEFTDVQTVQPVAVSFNAINRFLDRIEEFVWADRIEIYIGEGKTFRYELPLPKPYKGGRESSVKPHYLKDVKLFMQNYHEAKIISGGLEVDDYVTIRAYEELAKGNAPIICTVDKDAYQSQNISIFNWMKEPWSIESIPVVGTLTKEGSAIKGNGLKFLAYQVLAGDDADTYCAYDISTVKYGPAKALNALQSSKTEQEVLRVLCNEFKRLYPTPVTYTDVHGKERCFDWLEMLRLYWKVAYMKRSKEDTSEFLDFAASRGFEP